MGLEAFGAYLRREREMRGISLREVAQTTKISLRSLEALEGERFEELGGDVFVRGFLRNYARYLGLNPDEVVLRWEELAQSLKPSPAPAVAETANVFQDRRSALLIGAAVAALLGVVVLIGMLTSAPPPPKPEPIHLAAFPAAVTAPEEAPAPVSEPVAPPPPIPSGFLLEIAADEPTYVKLWVDGAQPIERELPPGGEMHFRGRERMEILLGNAGGVNLRLDGKAIPKLGLSGRVRRRIITREGVFPP